VTIQADNSDEIGSAIISKYSVVITAGPVINSNTIFTPVAQAFVIPANDSAFNFIIFVQRVPTPAARRIPDTGQHAVDRFDAPALGSIAYILGHQPTSMRSSPAVPEMVFSVTAGSDPIASLVADASDYGHASLISCDKVSIVSEKEAGRIESGSLFQFFLLRVSLPFGSPVLTAPPTAHSAPSVSLHR
jgi:hypothetical protein